MATAEAIDAGTEAGLLTVEQYAERPDTDGPTELVRGRVVAMPPPGARHGYVCYRATILLASVVEARGLGRLLTNDSGVITEREPDTLRGADVAYYSYDRLPRGPVPAGYPAAAPDLVVEVRSPSDRWADLFKKVAEYLGVGVRAVVVLDPDEPAAYVFVADRPVRILRPGDDLTLPEIFGEEFRVPVAAFFE